MSIFSRQTFDNFIVGETNRAAFLAAVEAGKNPGGRYNPLFIYGGTGTGKSHLLRAIADKMGEKDPLIRVCVESYPTFCRPVLESIEAGHAERWQASVIHFDAILLDDCRNDAGWVPFQNEMTPLIDRFLQEGKQLVLTSNHSPFRLQPVEERFLSRLQRGLIVSIGRPDRAMKRAMISRLIERSVAEVPEEALDHLADISVANARELWGIVNRILIALEAEEATLSGQWLDKTLRGLIRSGEVRLDRVVPVEEPIFEAFIPEAGRYRPVKEREPVPEAPSVSEEAGGAELVTGIDRSILAADEGELAEDEFEAVSVTEVEKGEEERKTEARLQRPEIGEPEGLILDWDREIDRLLNEL